MVEGISGPHVLRINVCVRSIIFGDTVIMVDMLDHLSDNYGWRVGNLGRLRDLADLSVNVKRIAEGTLPKLRFDVRNDETWSCSMGATLSSAPVQRRLGALHRCLL
uniref:Uncharacterized protein n=1 Tax=Leersia perrieri TaxID=77586 RepID=A0A0D9XFE6_9ORYZ